MLARSNSKGTETMKPAPQAWQAIGLIYVGIGLSIGIGTGVIVLLFSVAKWFADGACALH